MDGEARIAGHFGGTHAFLDDFVVEDPFGRVFEDVVPEVGDHEGAVDEEDAVGDGSEVGDFLEVHDAVEGGLEGAGVGLDCLG